MKKLTILLLIITLPIIIFAKGNVTISTTNITLEKNHSKTFKITATNSVGKIKIETKDNNIAKVNTQTLWIENETKTITINGLKEGKTTINIILEDISTFDLETLSGKIYTINVTVTPQKSSNNSLSMLQIENQKYDLNNKNIDLGITEKESINITATPKDNKAKINGAGTIKLNNGQNNLKLVITAENGNINTYNISITKKTDIIDSTIKNAINDLKSDAYKIINIKIENEEDIIPEEIFNTLKYTNKELRITKYENQKIIYTWSFKPNDIIDNFTFDSKVNFDTENKQNIRKLTNYSETLYINTSYDGTLPSNTTLTLNLENIFNEDDNLDLYYYNKTNNKLELKNEKIKIEDNKITLSLNHLSEYILTPSKAILTQAINTNTKNNTIIYIILIMILIVLTINIKLIKNLLKTN